MKNEINGLRRDNKKIKIATVELNTSHKIKKEINSHC